MGVHIDFVSGKSIDLKKATGFKENDTERFRGQDGNSYTAPAYVIFFGAGKKPIHYKKSMVRSIYKKDYAN